jgi:endonuclease/exonuclease/phosphatase family metal-dependent hydrolase
MFKKTNLFLCLLFVIQLQAQERLKLMSYNLMHYPSTYVYEDSSNTFVDRSTTLKTITDEIQPDILMVCELQNATGATAILDNVLNVGTSKYTSPNFVYNQSSSYTALNQFLYYNTDKLILENQSVLITAIRDINNYTFLLNTTGKDTNPIYLEVFVAHLKASTGAANEQKRLDMVNVFTANLASIPSNHHVVFAGDFNFYVASEDGYQEIIDTSNAITMIDPINREGSWHNNSSYKDIQTQSPLTTHSQFAANYGANGAGSDGTTGGLDDRFDFIMIDQNTATSAALHYVANSYKAFGNNGNCFNDNINDTDCSGAEYSQTTRNNLANMSDHLPVVMELETNQVFLAVEQVATAKILMGNVVSDYLSLQLNNFNNEVEYTIYNNLGQLIKKGIITDDNSQLDITSLDKGLYVLKIAYFKPLKFIKTEG